MGVGSIQFITDEETRSYLGGKWFLIVGVGWKVGFVGEPVWLVFVVFSLSSTSTFTNTPLAHTFPLSAKLPETLRTQTKVDFFVDKEDREETECVPCS